MLTIDDIKNVGFRRAKFGGYKPEDVDAFIDDVQISFEKMVREMNKMKETIRRLNVQVEKFEEEGRSIESVISGAKEAAEKTLDDARIHTSDMISDATKRSEEIMNKAKKEVEINREISERLKSESAKLRKKLDEIYKRHLEIIDEIPADVFAENDANKDGNSEPCRKSQKEEDIKVDINKPSDSGMKKRFFEIDANACKKVSCGSAAEKRVNIVGLGDDLFSSEEIKKAKDKFKDLKFGKNFDIDSENSKVSAGAYSGIFK